MDGRAAAAIGGAEIGVALTRTTLSGWWEGIRAAPYNPAAPGLAPVFGRLFLPYPT